MGDWLSQELANCNFADIRLEKRFSKLMKRLSEGIGQTIPLACRDWAANKAAYRFLDNDRVSEAEIPRRTLQCDARAVCRDTRANPRSPRHNGIFLHPK